jgi:hypothetical protein
MRARARIMSPNACDYGAASAALFDIVNVHLGRGAEPRRTLESRFHSGSGAAFLFDNLQRWLSSSGRALAS